MYIVVDYYISGYFYSAVITRSKHFTANLETKQLAEQSQSKTEGPRFVLI